MISDLKNIDTSKWTSSDFLNFGKYEELQDAIASDLTPERTDERVSERAAEWTATIKQDEAWKLLEDKVTEEVMFGGGAGGAKTFLGCMWIITSALQYERTRWLIARNVLLELEQSTLLTFWDCCRILGLKEGRDYKYNIIKHTITFNQTKSVVFLKELKWMPRDPEFDRLGSFEYTGVFIDEAQQIMAKAKDVLKTRIRYRLHSNGLIPKMLLTCNPAKNFLYKDFYKPWKNGTLPKHRGVVIALAKHNPFIEPSYIDTLKRGSKITIERLLMGNWEYDDDPAAMISFDAITDLFTNIAVLPDGSTEARLKWRSDGTLDFTAIRRAELAISCDVARYGQDRTVIMLWYGLQVVGMWVYDKTSIPTVIREVKRIEEKYKVPRSRIVIDDDGVGGGVSDGLNGCRKFNANASPMPKKENYRSLKVQCQYKLAELVNARALGVSTENETIQELITQELEQLKTKDADKDAPLNTVPKDQIKLILGRSPDFMDTLTMRMVFEVMPVARFTT